MTSVVEGAAPPHAPATGRLRRLLGRYYFTGVFWYRFHLWGMRICPDWTKPALVLAFATFFTLVLHGVRRGLGRNSELVLGPAGPLARLGRAARAIRSFSWSLSERYERFLPDTRFDFELEGVDHWEAARAAAPGVLLVTAHVGNWEVGSTLPSMEGRVVHLVREAELDAHSQRFVEGLLTSHGGVTYRTHFAGDDPALGVELLDALRRGEAVALQGDRPRAGGRSLSVPLFGHPFPMPIGPAVLARLAGVPMLPVFTLRRGRRAYRVAFRPPIEVEHTSDRDGDCARALARLAAEIEWAVRRAPEQWYLFRDLRAHS